jgi:hypothetical protein
MHKAFQSTEVSLGVTDVPEQCSHLAQSPASLRSKYSGKSSS